MDKIRLQIAETTIVDIIDMLNNSKSKYAIARNYENYPTFNHDVDIFSNLSISDQNQIIKSCAKKNQWDYVTNCNHWYKSKINNHNINVYQFYNFEFNEYLQIDFFNGFLINGISVKNSSELLKDIEFVKQKNFYKISNYNENFFRIFQIHKLIKSSLNTNKVHKYIKRFFQYYDCSSHKINNEFKKNKLYLMPLAILFLKNNKIFYFRFIVSLSKVFFVIINFFNSPCFIIKSIYARFKFLLNNYFIHQCGLRINICVQNTNIQKKIEIVLDSFVKNKIIPRWSYSSFLKFKNNLDILERGGVIIKFTNNKKISKLIIDADNENDIKKLLFDIIVFRHKIL